MKVVWKGFFTHEAIWESDDEMKKRFPDCMLQRTAFRFGNYFMGIDF